MTHTHDIELGILPSDLLGREYITPEELEAARGAAQALIKVRLEELHKEVGCRALDVIHAFVSATSSAMRMEGPEELHKSVDENCIVLAGVAIGGEIEFDAFKSAVLKLEAIINDARAHVILALSKAPAGAQ